MQDEFKKLDKRTKQSRFPGSFFLYISYEGLPGNRVLFVLLSKYQICLPATRLPDSHFRDLFSCTFLTKDFPETGSKLPALPGFYSGRWQTYSDYIQAHLPAMNFDKALGK